MTEALGNDCLHHFRGQPLACGEKMDGGRCLRCTHHSLVQSLGLCSLPMAFHLVQLELSEKVLVVDHYRHLEQMLYRHCLAAPLFQAHGCLRLDDR